MTLTAQNVSWILFFIFISLQTIAQNNFIVEGRVVDLDTKQPLKNVSVIVRQTKTGTTTNDSGYFKLRLYSPDQAIVFSFIGYVHNTRELHLLESNKPINIELKKKARDFFL